MSTVQQKMDRLNKRLAVAGLEVAVFNLQHKVETALSSDEVAGVVEFSLTGRKSVSQDGMEDGRVRFEGLAAGYDIDRDSEAFIPGAFEQGVKNWIRRGGVLLWNHDYGKPMGVIEEATITSSGLWIRGVLDDPEPGTEMADIHNKVKSGTVRGLSIGGIFKRKQTLSGPRIYSADITECSLCAAPKHAESLFTLSGKSAGSDADKVKLAAELMASLDRFGERVAAL